MSDIPDTPSPRAGFGGWRYPHADRDDDVVTPPPGSHASSGGVADPYRWLEDPYSPRTRAFVAAQNALSGEYLAGLPARGWFTAALDTLLAVPRSGVPHRRGQWYLRWHHDGRREQGRVFVAPDLDSLLTNARLLVDPAAFDPDGGVSLRQVHLSPDGSRAAYGLSEAGSDWIEWRVRDTATGEDLPDRVTRAKFSTAEWLPDGSGFLYWGYPERDETTGDDPTALGAGRLLRHRLGTAQADDEVVYYRPDRPRERAAAEITEDGRWLVLSVVEGTARRNRILVRRVLPDGGFGPTLPVVPEPTALYQSAGNDGDVLYLHTDDGAPRHRLLAVDLAAVEENTAVEGAAAVEENTAADEGTAGVWWELIGARDQVLTAAVRAGDGFLAVYLDDAAHRVYRAGRDGALGDELTLPSPCSLVGLSARPGDDEMFLGVTTFAEPQHTYRVDLGTGALSPLPAGVGPAGDPAGDRAGGLAGDPARDPDPGAAAVAGLTTVTTRERATSADGTTVPYFLVRRADLPDDAPRPTVLYGYGGFHQPVTPAYQPAWTAWLAAGGALAVANLRGGGEFGREWYEAGTRDRKQHVFDDFAAVARHLVDTGATTRAQLALHGRSNGGLLVGATMTQHPELAAVALPMVGVLDMLRFAEFTIGWAWIPDYGDPADPADFAVLHAYSPLHNLRDGERYPATLVLTGDHDDRVVPAHSLKFIAALQRAHAGEAPVLARVETATGHGLGKPRSAELAETADMLSFAAHHTGLAPPAAGGPQQHALGPGEDALSREAAAARAGRGPD